MPEAREPFFTPDEWKVLAVLRPHEWHAWWSTEPLITKIVIGALAALGAYGAYEVGRGDASTGWVLIGVAGSLLAIVFVFIPVLYVLFAAIRWLFRVTGIAALWRRVRPTVVRVVTLIFWAAIAIGILADVWPYLSTDPVRSWAAFTNRVPVEQVEVLKKPHDCEFGTAPLGSKHCHYEAKVTVVEGVDSADGKKSLLVTYERIED